ncbi:hypothetical protein Leryth_024978 [Lithospermum erythrorhizon]|uniref:Protein kinase domain-containing protein n=1 Tax=Lithospermum erythrorhizon TaxID=34254 RepID=A0AAV3PXG7_LITER|nr:hypothetical protein Leryth_024978 [Lithospermum erythrorhizon]
MCAIKEVKLSNDQTSKECLKQLNQGEEALLVYLEYVSWGSIHKLLQENTVHRDIKGANILVDPNGEIKVAYFGMAKHDMEEYHVRCLLRFQASNCWKSR